MAPRQGPDKPANGAMSPPRKPPWGALGAAREARHGLTVSSAGFGTLTGAGVRRPESADHRRWLIYGERKPVMGGGAVA